MTMQQNTNDPNTEGQDLTDEAHLARWAANLFARAARGEKVVIVDTETTGLDVTAEVIEVAIIDLVGNTLLDTRIKPQAEHIPEEASRVNHIYDRDVADKPLLPAVWKQIEEALRGATIIAYNAAFDSRLLVQSAMRYELSPAVVTQAPWECLMEAAAPVYGDGWWLSLARLCNVLEVDAGWHRALDDCRATLRCLDKLARINRRYRAEQIFVAVEMCWAQCETSGHTTFHHVDCPLLSAQASAEARRS